MCVQYATTPQSPARHRMAPTANTLSTLSQQKPKHRIPGLTAKVYLLPWPLIHSRVDIHNNRCRLHGNTNLKKVFLHICMKCIFLKVTPSENATRCLIGYVVILYGANKLQTFNYASKQSDHVLYFTQHCPTQRCLHKEQSMSVTPFSTTCLNAATAGVDSEFSLGLQRIYIFFTIWLITAPFGYGEFR